MRKRSDLLSGMQGWQIQIVKWWHLVSKDKKLALCKWMHLNPKSRTIETRKHQITRVDDTQVYLLNTIQIAIQNEHGNVGGWNTPMQCERGESICPNHQVLHFSLWPSILKNLIQAWIRMHIPPREFADVPISNFRQSPVRQQIVLAPWWPLHIEPTSGVA